MTTRRLVTSLLAIAVVLGAGNVPYVLAQNQTPSQVQTASDLLQKGIYLQETVGDLDGAIKVYQQIIQMADGSRASAAQAVYRLGLCLQKKGRQAEADKTFQDLIAKYPDQGEVVSKARAFVASTAQPKLLPAPWKDGEVLELFQKLPSGMVGLVKRYSIASSKNNPGHWLLEDNTLSPMAQMVQWVPQWQTRVEVDKETMTPISTWMNMMGDSQITYQASQARVEEKGKDPRIVVLDGTTWDIEEVWALLRRLPLAPDYKTTLPFLGPTGLVLKVEFAVTGADDVKTPAGTFHCYRVVADALRQAFFISTDDLRYLVKIEMPVGSVELERVLQGAAAGPVAYKDDALGFSLSAPEGWQVYNYDSGKADSALANLVDPDSLVSIILSVNTLEAGYPATAEGMRERIQKEIDKGGDLRQFLTGRSEKSKVGGSTVRPDSWQTRQVGGRLAISWLVDFTDMLGNKKTAYTVEIRGDKTRARFTSNLKTDSDLAAFLERFDPIMAGLTIK